MGVPCLGLYLKTTMPAPSTLTFKWRGLLGVLLILVGVALGVVFRNSSSWPAETKQLVYPLALVLAVGGSNLFGSFVYRRPLHTMKMELLSSFFIVVTLVMTKH
jgi:drug/metabolite transporter (DMT)-like permease